MRLKNLFCFERRESLALIFRVIVDDVNIFSGDVADVVEVTKLAGLGVN